MEFAKEVSTVITSAYPGQSERDPDSVNLMSCTQRRAWPNSGFSKNPNVIEKRLQFRDYEPCLLWACLLRTQAAPGLFSRLCICILGAICIHLLHDVVYGSAVHLSCNAQDSQYLGLP